MGGTGPVPPIFVWKGCSVLRRFFTALLLCAVLLPGAALPAQALEPSSRPLYAGMDVSVYQGEIDFAAARADGIEVVYIRASYGSGGVDACLQSHYQGARAAGLRIGFYHFLYARTVEEARAEARFFASQLSGLDYDCRPVLDIEELSGLSSQEASAIAAAFLEELEALTGQGPMVYTSAYDASRVLDASAARWPLWAADYGPSQPHVTAHWSSWAGVQYTDRGTVAGGLPRPGAGARPGHLYRPAGGHPVGHRPALQYHGQRPGLPQPHRRPQSDLPRPGAGPAPGVRPGGGHLYRPPRGHPLGHRQAVPHHRRRPDGAQPHRRPEPHLSRPNADHTGLSAAGFTLFFRKAPQRLDNPPPVGYNVLVFEEKTTK